MRCPTGRETIQRSRSLWPEVMLHLREMGLLNLDVITAAGEKLSAVLDWWAQSERRRVARRRLRRAGQIDPDTDNIATGYQRPNDLVSGHGYSDEASEDYFSGWHQNILAGSS